MREIPLTRGYVTLVDDDDYEWLSQWEWHATTAGYAARAYDEAARILHGDVAVLNFPEEVAS